MSITKSAVLLGLGLIGWALCGSIIGIGRQLTTLNNTLIIHAVAVPVIFAVISFIYFTFFHYTTPLQTALFFTIFAILMDFFVIALFVEKSFDMFRSVFGTWIPFALIFISTFATGTLLKK